MGESKISKPAPHRPSLAIVRLKLAVKVSKDEHMDDATAEFMADLGALATWLDHLERQLASASVANEETTPNP